MSIEPNIRPDPELYARIVDQMGHSVIVVDGSRWVRFVSRSLARQLGEPSDLMLHTSLYDLCPGLPRAWMEEQFAQLEQLGEAGTETIRWRVRTNLFQPLVELHTELVGGRMYYQCELFLLQGQAEPLFCLTLDGPVPETAGQNETCTDFCQAQLDQAEQRLQHSEKLVTLGQLVAGVAHEINNPVCYVKTNLQTLQQYVGHLDRLLSESLTLAEASGNTRLSQGLGQLKQKFDYDFIHEELPLLLAETTEGVQRVEEIISTLRDYARNDASEGEWVDLNELLEAALKLVHHELKFVVTSVRRHYDTLPSVWCRPSQLTQVMVNLLVNAAQAMSRGGEIELRTRFLKAEGRVEIDICDQGEGIDPEIMPVLFNAFVTSKPPGKGTGLGLSVSQQIISSHQGAISASNREGGGACFKILLPVGAGD